MSLPVSFAINSKGSPHTWTQKGECVNTIFAAERPFFQWHSRSRLLSKFHGPFLSTHSIWYCEMNLNCSIPLPTSTFLKFDPIFHTDLSVLLRARWFCCLSDWSYPKRLRAHSSRRSALSCIETWISSSSSLVNCRFCNPSRIACSILKHCMNHTLLQGIGNLRESPTQKLGERRTPTSGERKESYRGEKKIPKLIFIVVQMLSKYS